MGVVKAPNGWQMCCPRIPQYHVVWLHREQPLGGVWFLGAGWGSPTQKWAPGMRGRQFKADQFSPIFSACKDYSIKTIKIMSSA